jgi:serine/threonine-protein kinase
MPDGRSLIVGGRTGLAWVSADGATAPTPLLAGTQPRIPWSVSSDGQRLAYYEMSPATGFDIWTVPLRRNTAAPALGAPEPFLQSPAYEVYPSFSPDGWWIAYSSNESGRYEIYVRRFPDDGSKVRISTGGGRIARWAQDGRELMYQTDDQRINVVTYRVENGVFSAEKPRLFTRERLGDAGVFPSFDLAPNGARILALVPAAPPEERQSINHVTVVLNFFDEVARRAGRPR